MAEGKWAHWGRAHWEIVRETILVRLQLGTKPFVSLNTLSLEDWAVKTHITFMFLCLQRQGRCDTYATEFDLEAEEYVPLPKGDVHKKKEIIQDVTLHDLDVANARPQVLLCHCGQHTCLLSLSGSSGDESARSCCHFGGKHSFFVCDVQQLAWA